MTALAACWGLIVGAAAAMAYVELRARRARRRLALARLREVMAEERARKLQLLELEEWWRLPAFERDGSER